jgi:hypothetical protein
MGSAAGTLKRLTLELGGNDAAIVLEDIDPKEVAPKIYAGAMFNAGQGCVTIKRVYVHDSIYDAVCDELGRLARDTVVGDGLEPGTQMGPIQNQAQFEKVKGFLEDARRNGTIVAGGGVLEREGYFVQPTIVRDKRASCRRRLTKSIRGWPSPGWVNGRTTLATAKAPSKRARCLPGWNPACCCSNSTARPGRRGCAAGRPRRPSCGRGRPGPG